METTTTAPTTSAVLGRSAKGGAMSVTTLPRKPKRPGRRWIAPPPGRPTRIANLEVDRLCVRTPGGRGAIWLGFDERTGAPRIDVTDEAGHTRLWIGQDQDGLEGYAVTIQEPNAGTKSSRARATLAVFENGDAAAVVYDGDGHPVRAIHTRRASAGGDAASTTPPAPATNGAAH